MAPVFDVAQAIDNAFVHERNGTNDCNSDNGHQARRVAHPMRVPGVALPARGASRMDEQNVTPLSQSGSGAAQISKLRERGVIAPV
jgi:crotonobetainyl-CoA:carnitine CoA-transferase CaiB-like acyl-CoA transferase